MAGWIMLIGGLSDEYFLSEFRYDLTCDSDIDIDITETGRRLEDMSTSMEDRQRGHPYHYAQPYRHHARSGSAGSSAGRGISLVISSNLDALLLHDGGSADSAYGGGGSAYVRDEEGALVSLPPPPRGNAKRGTEVGSRDAGEKGRGRGRVVAMDPRTPTMMKGAGRALLGQHGSSASVSSVSSASGGGSSTRPASTAENEARVSISSTVYAASSTGSVRRSLYEAPGTDRGSFIDLYSPLQHDFSLDPPSSPIRFAPMAPLDSQPPPPNPVCPRPSIPDSERPPPTTNFLDMGERADLVRKSRKLARVFGTTPGADAMAQQDALARPRAALALLDQAPRRHSMPLSPDDVSFLSIVSPALDALAFPRPESPTSFIDLDDDDRPALRSRVSVQSIDTVSSSNDDDDDDLAEDQRRRKRERLAKLHRFLGSRVPAHLVLGLADPADPASLPPPQASSEDDSPASRKTWLKRRRSSSAVILPSFRLDELERVKEELDDKEKAINVRRAHKMEKVFGVAPPQTLYHTRHCPTPRPLSSGDPSTSSGTGTSTPSSFLGALPIIPAKPTRSASTSRASYLPKVRTKPKKGARPGTAESSKQLIPKDAPTPTATALSPGTADPRHSFIYSHYQHSLNSLGDILDRDDRASLVELHEYLNNPDVPTPTRGAPAPPVNDDDNLVHALTHRLSLASLKSERRRSLPARTSMISLASITSPTHAHLDNSTPDAADFQQRRRRAAKLAQFFGVNYRELVADVLDSIENGVEHEGARGALRAEEVEDLLTKLRSLKTKRTSLFS